MPPRKSLSTPSPHLPEWQHVYESVLTETDTSELFKLVEIAESSVLTRRSALAGSADHHAERKAIDEALANLRAVKKDRLKFRQQYFPD